MVSIAWLHSIEILLFITKRNFKSALNFHCKHQKIKSQFGFGFKENQTIQTFQFHSVGFYLKNCPIGCQQKLQSTSKVQTYTSKAESQELFQISYKLKIIVCKSFTRVVYHCYMIMQLIAENAETDPF